MGSVLEEAITVSGRQGVLTDTMDPPDDFEFPIVPTEDDEPDAPTHVPSAEPSTPTMVAVPELTHPGESASNGLAERSVRTLEEQTRTFLAALEARIKLPIPSDHPMLGWIVEHASYILNNYVIGDKHKTAYARLHGKERSEKLCNLGE